MSAAENRPDSSKDSEKTNTDGLFDQTHGMVNEWLHECTNMDIPVVHDKCSGAAGRCLRVVDFKVVVEDPCKINFADMDSPDLKEIFGELVAVQEGAAPSSAATSSSSAASVSLVEEEASSSVCYSMKSRKNCRKACYRRQNGCS